MGIDFDAEYYEAGLREVPDGDASSGRFSNENIEYRFATYPYIGSKYTEAKNTLFIGMDIGKDTGQLRCAECRRSAVEEPTDSKGWSRFNPHIQGTFIEALGRLKDNLGLGNEYRALLSGEGEENGHFKRKNFNPGIPFSGPDSRNPLSYVALTNFYKFVSVNQENRRDSARFHFNGRLERELLRKEVEDLEPKEVIFQGKNLVDKEDSIIEDIREVNSVDKIFITDHPSSAIFTVEDLSEKFEDGRVA